MKKIHLAIASASLLLFQAFRNHPGSGASQATAIPAAHAGYKYAASGAVSSASGAQVPASPANASRSIAAPSIAAVRVPASSMPGGIVIDWNLITVKATKIGGFNSNLASRIEAIEAIAVYDAVNSIQHFGTPYHYFVSPGAAASPQAAVAQAAHDVLVNYFPAQKPSLDSALAASLSEITGSPAGSGGSSAAAGATGQKAAGEPAGQGTTAGSAGQRATAGPSDPGSNGETADPEAGTAALISTGQSIGSAAAADIIALRANDGSEPNVGYPGPAKPGIGQYRPTPAGFAPGINQQWGKVKPFILTSDDQFRPAPPPAVGSTEYKKALAEVEEIGSASSKTRTADQGHIAQFYKQDAELTVNEAARELARIHGSSLEDNALIFLLADLAEADARIAIWDAKYTYLFWRPVTSLNADPDGAVTNNYSKWTPLLSTPPHPSYPCGHCGTVEAGFEVLKKFFGDKNTFELHTSTAGEPSRVLHSLSEGEEENQHSRLYGGIHYPFDNSASQELGAKVAEYVIANGPKRK